MRSIEDSMWQRAFQWLTAIELDGHDSTVAVSVSGDALRARVQTLVILFDLLPRSETGRLDVVAAAWSERFGDRPFVPLRELRTVARDVLVLRASESDAESLWQRAVSLSGLADARTHRNRLDGRSSDVTPEDRKHCADGILSWLRELQDAPEWRSIPGVIPGEADRPIRDVYVELLAIEDTDVVSVDEMSAGGRRIRQTGQLEQTVPVTVEAMISRTVERCIVTGDPGSGKTTLLRWLVWAAFQGRLEDFDLAVEVKLSAYAGAIITEEGLSPLEFFFRSRGLEPEKSRQAARGLCQAARESYRWLLLLDGWDEVPVTQRAAVKAQLVKVESAFVTVITSRPAGMPRQLVERQNTSCYRIAGLTPLLAQELTAKVLGEPEGADACLAIWRLIQADAQLLGMSSNPFLLGMLVRALASSESALRGTRADIYRHLIAWVREHYEQVRGERPPLTARHMDGLAELSFRLLNDPALPRYLFSRRELEASLIGLDVEPVLQSRFVTRPASLLDEFALLHATMQEFLAAEHVTGIPNEKQRAFLERAFHSPSRFIILEFFVGLEGGGSSLVQQTMQSWWDDRDRFLQVAVRLARLAVAGRWPTDELTQAVREVLWAEITSDEELDACEIAVASYAELDSAGLVQRARRHPPSSWAVNCLMNSIPADIAKRERLHELLTPEWAEFEGAESEPVETAVLKERLAQWDCPAEDLNEAVRQAGATLDASLLPLLVRIAQGDSLHATAREEAISSIGRIGGSAAIPAMVEILLSGGAVTDVMARMAGIIFTQPSSQRLRLDPRGRDRILRRLASIPPSHAHTEYYLNALHGFPIRDGADVIASLASGSDVPIGVCRKAIAALGSVSDRGLLTSLLSKIDTQPPELVGDWLMLALNRSLPVPLSWLQELIGRTRNRLQQDKYLRVYCRVLASSQDTVPDQSLAYLDRLAARAMTSDDTQGDLAVALTGALNGVSTERRILLTRKSLDFALKSLRWAVEGREHAGSQSTLLAIAIIRHFRDGGAASVLRSLLDHLREDCARFADDKRARAVADCLAELVPDELLKSPASCPVVTSILRTRSIRQGWVVYSDRILNAEGQCIASLVKAETRSIHAGEPLELREILSDLPPKARCVLESFWLMTRANGPCHTNDSYSAIHAAALAHYESADESDAGRVLDELFADGFPKFGTWIRQLNRIEKTFSERDEVRAVLHSLGLYRRS